MPDAHPLGDRRLEALEVLLRLFDDSLKVLGQILLGHRVTPSGAAVPQN
jgi:hypothetical protein